MKCIYVWLAAVLIGRGSSPWLRCLARAGSSCGSYRSEADGHCTRVPPPTRTCSKTEAGAEDVKLLLYTPFLFATPSLHCGLTLLRYQNCNLLQVLLYTWTWPHWIRFLLFHSQALVPWYYWSRLLFFGSVLFFFFRFFCLFVFWFRTESFVNGMWMCVFMMLGNIRVWLN